MFSKLAIAIGFIAGSISVAAFQEIPGGACTGSGACSYSYTNSAGGTTVVNGNCAPNGFCADNGATCGSDGNCYNSCGSGTCGGVGATCDTTDAFAHGAFGTACDTCNTANSVCVAVAQPSRRAVARKVDYDFKYFNPRVAAPAPAAAAVPVAPALAVRKDFGLVAERDFEAEEALDAAAEDLVIEEEILE